MSFVWPTMLHIKNLMGMHNKETYMHVCARIDIRICAKYECIICVCVVRIYLSCTVWAIQREQYLLINIFIFKENLYVVPMHSPKKKVLHRTVPFIPVISMSTYHLLLSYLHHLQMKDNFQFDNKKVKDCTVDHLTHTITSGQELL